MILTKPLIQIRLTDKQRSGEIERQATIVVQQQSDNVRTNHAAQSSHHQRNAYRHGPARLNGRVLYAFIYFTPRN